MPDIKIVGRGVDTLVLNVCYADKQFQPIKQELDTDLQEELSSLQDEARFNEAAVVTPWPGRRADARTPRRNTSGHARRSVMRLSRFRCYSMTCLGNICGYRSLRLICARIAWGGM